MFNHIWIVSARGDENKSCWHATRSNSWLLSGVLLSTSKLPPCRLWWGQSSPVQVLLAQLTGLWLILCPHLVPLWQPQKCPHVSLIPLYTGGRLSLHTDDSWLLDRCSTPVWKFPICFLYKWSWVELFWQVGHISRIGMTCCFDTFKSDCKHC